MWTMLGLLDPVEQWTPMESSRCRLVIRLLVHMFVQRNQDIPYMHKESTH